MSLRFNPVSGQFDLVGTAGGKLQDAVAAATTANLTATYNNGASGVGATLTNSGAQAALVVDGYTVQVGDRILVKNQSTQAQNGIYVVTSTGSGSTNWVLTRAANYDQPSEIVKGSLVPISGGNTQANQIWIETNSVNTIGTDPIAYVLFSAILTVQGNNPSNNGFGAYVSSSGTIDTVNVYGLAKWVVNPTAGLGTHQTIQAAINAASAGDTVFITANSSGYTEDLTLKAGVNLAAFVGDALTPNVKIIGNATATFAGSCTISGIELQTNSAPFLTISGSNATIVNLTNCLLNCTNNTGISFTSSSSSALLNINYCNGNLTTTGIAYFAMSSPGIMRVKYCDLQNDGGSSTANTCSAGSVSFKFVDCKSPLSFSSSATSATLENSNINTGSLNVTGLTTAGTGTFTLVLSHMSSGSASCISVGSGTTVQSNNCVLNCSNTNVITGAGTLNHSNNSFTGTGTQVNVTTQVPNDASNDALSVKTPGSYPYTTIPQDCLILVDSTSARTITPLGSPTKGQLHRIKDKSGLAATNNITISPAGGNTIDGASSYTIKSNYGAVDIIYNGTEWNVL